PTLTALLLHLLLACSAAEQQPVPPESIRRSVSVDGDIILGGLFPIHSSAETSSGESRCGRMESHRGIQRMEAMIFTLQEVNLNSSLLRYGRHKIQLGGLLFDTCSKDTTALERALEFVKSSLNQEVVGTSYSCLYGNGTILPAVRYSAIVGPAASASTGRAIAKPIRGVVGGAYTQVSVQVANLLRLFAIPQISYASTSSVLGDKTRFEFFARTLPSDVEQARALADIVVHFNWTFVSTVFSKGDYGEGGIQSFESELDKLGVCVAERLLINLEPTKAELDVIVDRLREQQTRARVVVMFTREDHTELFLDAVRRANLSSGFVWLSADGWGKSSLPVKNNTAVANGALTLEIASSEVPGFTSYFTGLRPRGPRAVDNNASFSNHFFDEFWQQKFNCRFVVDPTKNDTVACRDNMRIDAAKFRQEHKVQFVYDAVYAFAHGLEQAKRLVCTEQPPDADTKASGLFDQCVANLSSFPGKELYNLLISPENFFVNSARRKVQFTKNGDGVGAYRIYNYRRNRETGHFDYQEVGEWSNSTGLSWRPDRQIFWSGSLLDVPRSRCSEECEPGQRRMYGRTGAGKDRCCWSCTECAAHQRVADTRDACEDCGELEGPDWNKTRCLRLQVQHMQWGSWYSAVAMALSSIGIICTLLVVGTFLRYNDTPIVKASGRELSYLLLSGCLLCYLMTFLLLMKPSTVACCIQRVGIGLGFSVMYASLLIKTNRIARIFEAASSSARRPQFISPRSQLCIGACLVGVQLGCSALWLMLSPPGTRIQQPSRLEAILRCSIEEKSFLVSLLYNMILIVVCTYYAVRTRSIPENFNESKFIGFTMYTTCIIWLAFLPLYFGTQSSFEVQICTLCVSISLSASVALACLFTPKLYVIYFHPEKNVRRLTLNSGHHRKHASSSGSCGN
uniref:G_PROTEIN_RECEP_F3_4 domain-containing protein n=1 Tax=Macrostomum lignano TaxID=282301 RepID=A0A1I8HQK1_9PLAT